MVFIFLNLAYFAKMMVSNCVSPLSKGLLVPGPEQREQSQQTGFRVAHEYDGDDYTLGSASGRQINFIQGETRVIPFWERR